MYFENPYNKLLTITIKNMCFLVVKTQTGETKAAISFNDICIIN